MQLNVWEFQLSNVIFFWANVNSIQYGIYIYNNDAVAGVVANVVANTETESIATYKTFLK